MAKSGGGGGRFSPGYYTRGRGGRRKLAKRDTSVHFVNGTATDSRGRTITWNYRPTYPKD